MAFTPSTYDFTNAALFRLTFTRIPNTEYESYSVNVPGVAFGEAIQPTPLLDIKLPGDKLVYEPLILNFIVQEDLKNYIEIYNWMVGLGNPKHTDQYKALKENSTNQNIYSDATLTILTNKSNPVVRVKFINCWPTALAPLTYDASVTDATPITADATFNYMYYEFETI